MPTREVNRAHWTADDWKEGGDDGAPGRGSSRMPWSGTILPRIHFPPPAPHRIAHRGWLFRVPGRGRA